MTYTALAFLGFCLGSFINALVWRLYKQSHGADNAQHKKQSVSKNTSPYSILRGRSVCVHCKRQLSAHDLVPVVSWIWLKGKCRYCHKPIGPQYPIVELLTGLLFAVSYIFWPLGLGAPLEWLLFAVWLAMVTVMMALAVYDIRWYLLPNKLVAILGGLAAGYFALSVLAGADTSLMSALLSAAGGMIMLGGLFHGIFILSQGKFIGGGDVKLGYALGLLVANPLQSVLLLFVASIIGSAIAMPLMVTKKLGRKSHLPFGPLLLVAAYIITLFGDQLIRWYQINILLM